MEAFLRWLVERGFHASTAVELPGEFSHRGGILDIYAPDWLRPVRVELLGEKLIAFRDGKGRVGLLREFCAHRGASLYFGRNGEDGLRCWYHGWKWDVNGACVDQPNMPDDRRFCDKVRQVSYACVEKHGVGIALAADVGGDCTFQLRFA